MSQYKISKTRLAEIIKEEYSSIAEDQRLQASTAPSLVAAIEGLENHWDTFTSQVMEHATDDHEFSKDDVANAIRLKLVSLGDEVQAEAAAPPKEDEALDSIRELIRQELQSL
jgi:phosphotransferase system HPr-like phosphotransfer protein